MKLLIFVCVVAMGVTVVMIFQLVRQELTSRNVRDSTINKAAEISRQETALAGLKKNFWGKKDDLEKLTKQVEELKKTTDTLKQEKITLEGKIGTCNKEKGDVEKTKNEVTDSFGKRKDEHDEAKQIAQKTIEDLKARILEREKTICLSVDTTNAEARKLCGIGDPQ
ncbi:uncharacterized protein [Eucyclogobius newberryi]|uniref:uncharacterized protein n=1 Tax=Eucyclogobius newberryi TaxID=166745 RepID=UPI003B5B0947